MFEDENVNKATEVDSDEMMYIMMQGMNREADKVVSPEDDTSRENVAMAARDNDIETLMASCAKYRTLNGKLLSRMKIKHLKRAGASGKQLNVE